MPSKQNISLLETDRRVLPDRRKRPTPLISRYILFGGRRRNIRRQEDRLTHLLVDHYSPRLLITILCIIVLSLCDSYLTLHLLKDNIATEANPVMAFYLEFGDIPFITAKYLLTIGSIFILCLCNNFSVTGIIMPSAAAVYLAVIIYQISIICKLF